MQFLAKRPFYTFFKTNTEKLLTSLFICAIMFTRNKFQIEQHKGMEQWSL